MALTFAGFQPYLRRIFEQSQREERKRLADHIRAYRKATGERGHYIKRMERDLEAYWREHGERGSMNG